MRITQRLMSPRTTYLSNRYQVSRSGLTQMMQSSRLDTGNNFLNRQLSDRIVARLEKNYAKKYHVSNDKRLQEILERRKEQLEKLEKRDDVSGTKNNSDTAKKVDSFLPDKVVEKIQNLAKDGVKKGIYMGKDYYNYYNECRKDASLVSDSSDASKRAMSRKEEYQFAKEAASIYAKTYKETREEKVRSLIENSNAMLQRRGFNFLI